jgi:hypothetical protein
LDGARQGNPPQELLAQLRGRLLGISHADSSLAKIQVGVISPGQAIMANSIAAGELKLENKRVVNTLSSLGAVMSDRSDQPSV